MYDNKTARASYELKVIATCGLTQLFVLWEVPLTDRLRVWDPLWEVPLTDRLRVWGSLFFRPPVCLFTETQADQAQPWPPPDLNFTNSFVFC